MTNFFSFLVFSSVISQTKQTKQRVSFLKLKRKVRNMNLQKILEIGATPMLVLVLVHHSFKNAALYLELTKHRR